MQSYLDAALAVQTSVLCMLTFVWCAPVLDTLKQLVVEVIRQRLGRLFRPTCIAVAAAVCLVSLMGYKSEERRDWHIDCSVLSLASLVLVFRLVSLLHERQAAENEATKQRRLAANKSELARTLSENNRQLHSAAEDMRKQGFLHTSESQRLFNTAPGRDVERIQHFVEQNSQLRTANKKLLAEVKQVQQKQERLQQHLELSKAETERLRRVHDATRRELEALRDSLMPDEDPKKLD